MSINRQLEMQLSDGFLRRAEEHFGPEIFQQHMNNGTFVKFSERCMHALEAYCRQHNSVHRDQFFELLSDEKLPYLDVAAQSAIHEQYTLLHGACGAFNDVMLEDVIDRLLELGAPTHLTDAVGYTPLVRLLSVFDQHIRRNGGLGTFLHKTIEALLDAGSPISGIAMDIGAKHPNLLQQLIDAGGDPTLTTNIEVPNRDFTVTRNLLHVAADAMQPESVRQLLNAGTSIAFCNQGGETPLEFCETQVKQSIPDSSERDDFRECYGLMTAAKKAAQTLATEFETHRDINQIPDNALALFSNLERLSDVLQPTIWQQNPTRMLELIDYMPPYFAAKYPRELTAIHTTAAARTRPSNQVAGGWPVEETCIANKNIGAAHGK